MKSFLINLSTQNSLKLILSLKKCCENPLLAVNDPFPHCASWQYMAAVDILIKKMPGFEWTSW